MVDLRAELAALVAAYDKHRKWTLNAVFEGLHQAVEHARAVLAAEPQIEAPGWCETDAEQYAWQAGWEARDDAMLQPSLPVADGEVVELPPRPPLMEPPAHPALERYGITWDGSPDKPLLTRMADGYWTPWHVAADLLERQALRPIPVSERLPGPSVKVLAHYFNDLGKGRTICAIWVPAKTRSDSYGDDGVTEYDEVSDTFYWPEGWYEAIENWDDLGYIKVDEGEVLYWQPLPKWPAHALPLPEVE